MGETERFRKVAGMSVVATGSSMFSPTVLSESLVVNPLFPAVVSESLVVNPFLPQGADYRMREIMHLAHDFLQHFCRKCPTNQRLLHGHLDLFLQSGDNVRGWDSLGVRGGRLGVWV